LKEIGEALKKTREENGISLEEAAEDLKFRASQIKKIEDGDFKSFKDVFYLKHFIKEYAKYLGLDPNELIDNFNEFVFDYTSKIPTEDIKRVINKKKKKEDKKIIASPYTLKKKKQFSMKSWYIYVVMFLLVLLIIYFIVNIYGADVI